jgi:hypothetical protein
MTYFSVNSIVIQQSLQLERVQFEVVVVVVSTSFVVLQTIRVFRTRRLLVRKRDLRVGIHLDSDIEKILPLIVLAAMEQKRNDEICFHRGVSDKKIDETQ